MGYAGAAKNKEEGGKRRECAKNKEEGGKRRECTTIKEEEKEKERDIKRGRSLTRDIIVVVHGEKPRNDKSLIGHLFLVALGF
ncbi:hypothetical protein BHM03_00016797 [Ensete ventricosum]|nr:hypothetical protein BHM03_00016797 [Ensete ventricosum]